MQSLRATVCLLTLLCGLAACGSDGSTPAPTPKKAAEPATAAAPTARPAGTTLFEGARPEGIVYDSHDHLLAVAVRDSNRLQLLNPTTLEQEKSVPLPGSVRHLQLGADGRSVLVPDETAGEILQVRLPGGAIEATKVEKQPHDAAQSTNGDVIVGNEFSKSISIVRNGKVIKTIADLRQPGGVIADGNTVGVVDVGAYTLSTYDLTTLKRTGRIAAGKGPTHGLLISGNRMLVSDTRGNQILVFSVDPLKQVASLPLPGNPYGVAIDDKTDTAWITLTKSNQVVGLDVSGTTPKVIARYNTVQQPNTVAVAPGSKTIWITGSATGVVQRITR